MTGEEFKAALVALGWKQADLCRKFEITKNTPSAWAAKGPPPWAAEYLRVMLELDRLHRTLVRPPKAAKATSGEPVGTGRAARIAKRLVEQGLPGENAEQAIK